MAYRLANESGVNHDVKPPTDESGEKRGTFRFRLVMHDPSRGNNRNSLGGLSALVKPRPEFALACDSGISRKTSLDKTPTVLVADDNDDTRQMFQAMLGARGYRVIQASDGEQAVDVIQHENPGLVLLDLGLPRLNGLNVIRRLRKDLGLTEVPLVVITGNDTQFETAVAAGCDDYLLKPIDFDRLAAILDYYVPVRARGDAA